MVGFIGILSNRSISLLKQKEAEVAQERVESAKRQHELEELALLAQHSAVGLARISLDGKFLTVNGSWLQLCKPENPDDLNGWRANVDPRDLNYVDRSWKQ